MRTGASTSPAVGPVDAPGRTFALVAAVVGLLACSAWAASTYLLTQPALPTWAYVVPLLGAIALTFYVVAGSPRRDWRYGRWWWRADRATVSFRELRQVPVAVLVASAALLLTDLHRRVDDDDAWRLPDQGRWPLLRELPRIAYASVGEHLHEQQLLDQSFFTALSAAFYLFAAFYLYGSLHWWGQSKEQDSAT